MRPDQLFSLLGDPTRYSILQLLGGAPGGLAAGDIARSLGVSAPAVSQHLRTLKGGGLVTAKRDGRRVIYRLEGEPRRRLRELASGMPGAPGPKRDVLSARNRLLGTVTAIERDRVTAGITLDVGGQRVQAVITTSALDELGIEVGDDAYAVIKATEVMLMR